MKEASEMSRNTFRTALAGVVVLAVATSSATVRAAEAGLSHSPHQTRSPSMFDVPETVDPAQAFSVSILDQRTGGRLELWSVAPQGGNHDLLGSVTVEGALVTMAAPKEPGSYRLRYVSADGRLRASRALEVAAVPIVLAIPEQMRAGREAEIRWRGPARPGDMLRIVTSDTGAVLAEVPVRGRAGVENVTLLRAPEDVGEYALEYRSGEREATLRTLPISVIRG